MFPKVALSNKKLIAKMVADFSKSVKMPPIFGICYHFFCKVLKYNIDPLVERQRVDNGLVTELKHNSSNSIF
ncbi:hypothetical protein AB835_14365 [Candidatus Endobugula sertula]|uniref:Uncharacterized protein n=1 Tax=Candidatus Endobugula sertula TaxID=62101 RepID=A0A1D2QLF0_9GAMM|nr:hypothetical protein AB835_14365 [Candidatus Endobugula sertula]